MKIDYTGKTIAVTGAGGSIGRASAQRFASCGGALLITDINEAALKETADLIEETGGTVSSLVCDVTDPDQAASVVQATCDRFGGIDVLYNNAGGSFPTPMQEIDRKEHERLRALNFDAVYHATMEALPIMVEAGSGVILATTSGAGSGAVGGLATYGAAKAGVNSFMRSVALEYGAQGIRANAIAPSAASNGLLAWLETTPGGVEGFAAKQPMGKLGTPDEIANVAAFLASDYASFVNGVVLPVDGGVEAMLAVPA
ncbi:MAG: short chain dehydrogenase [Deltaproteobacteria bacterium]|nr:short chain dehydrogenase [Deltaproteobacteria bacterium]